MNNWKFKFKHKSFKSMCRICWEDFMGKFFWGFLFNFNYLLCSVLYGQLILTRLKCLRLSKPPIPRPLTGMVALQKIQEEVSEVEEQYKQTLLAGALSPRWRWRASVFGTVCPVSLMEGLIVSGVITFATV